MPLTKPVSLRFKDVGLHFSEFILGYHPNFCIHMMWENRQRYCPAVFIGIFDFFLFLFITAER